MIRWHGVQWRQWWLVRYRWWQLSVYYFVITHLLQHFVERISTSISFWKVNDCKHIIMSSFRITLNIYFNKSHVQTRVYDNVDSKTSSLIVNFYTIQQSVLCGFLCVWSSQLIQLARNVCMCMYIRNLMKVF